MKSSIRLLILLTLLSSCDFNTNTVNPQASYNIKQSIEQKAFIGIYKAGPENDRPMFDTAWVEKSWKYEVRPKRVVFTTGNQLILKGFKCRSYGLCEEDKILKWDIITENGRKLDQNGDDFILPLHSYIPDAVKLYLVRLNEKRMPYDTIETTQLYYQK